MKNLSRIQNTSRALYFLYTALLFIVPLTVACYWAAFNSADLPLPRVVERLDFSASENYSVGILFLGFLVTMVPCAVLMYGLFQLRKLFEFYAQGRIFTVTNCHCLKNVSIALLAWTPARMLFDALVSIVLTSGNPQGQRFISISLEELELTTFLLGLILLVIAWVMGEAYRLQEEYTEIV